ncbi:hypothetical protein CQW23_13097 [Capsicum baccatum]|uniref:Uncharacterized protein n=1 Tax=Capsicum baccatum TaxID=33114 RepID=A0A2G2WUN9_CAPBA|nr:hypothetical protein CQW23_13097 [Capsicum baccatum]
MPQLAELMALRSHANLQIVGECTVGQHLGCLRGLSLPLLNPDIEQAGLESNGSNSSRGQRPLAPRPQQSFKARQRLPLLQPLAIARRSIDEWPRSGSDDIGEWPLPSTSSERDTNSNSERLNLDLSNIHKIPEINVGLTLWLQDSPSEDITSILYDVFDYFEDAREQHGRGFVHCYKGVSWSSSLVIGYLMWREGQSFYHDPSLGPSRDEHPKP